MKRPRLRISTLMLLVVIAALDAAIVRTIWSERTTKGELIIVGALPTANILAVVFLFGLSRPARRHFVAGFVAGGGFAIVSYAAWVWLSVATLGHILDPIFQPIGAFYRGRWPTVWRYLIYVTAIPILTVPQLLLAGLGGCLAGKLIGKYCATQPDPFAPK
jgi:hypothetical protein